MNGTDRKHPTRHQNSSLARHPLRDKGLLRLLLVLVCALTIMSACSESSNQNAQVQIQGTRLKSYKSLEELAGDAAAIAVIAPTGDTTTGTNGGIPYTIASVRVISSIKGTLQPDAVVPLRQLGSSNSNLAYSLVQAGQQYVAFMVSYRFAGADHDEWLVVGEPSGLFAVDKAGVLSKIDRDQASAALPATTSMQQVKAAATAAG